MKIKLDIELARKFQTFMEEEFERVGSRIGMDLLKIVEDHLTETSNHEMELYVLMEEDENIEKLLRANNVQSAAYSYQKGYYEGYGHIISKKDNKWFYDSLSHNSCTRPDEDITFEDWEAHDSLENLVNSFSDELKDQTKDLIDKLNDK